MKVPLVDLGWQRDVVEAEVTAGWAEVLRDTSFISGRAVTAFEQEFAAYTGVDHCVGVANGTDALEVALRALGVGAGDVVALPANTFIATAFAVLRCGAVPRLVDVDPGTLLVNPELLDLAGCRAVIPVHLFGQLAPMKEVLEVADGLPVVEDAAQSQGARGVGCGGAVTATSFYPGKNLGAYGDAGAVLTGDTDLARRVRLLANHGSEVRYVHETFGFNSRMDSLQAVVLSAKLCHLDDWNALRSQAAARYQELIAGDERIELLQTAPGNEHVWHLFPVRVPDRDVVLERLTAAGVGAGVHYPHALHQQAALAFLGHCPGDFPVAERAAASMLSLPLYPGITEGQQEYVVQQLRRALP